ncbi:MAG TPA: penicillin-binding transpeptidase domain-containing protein [Actinomycetota bacterium]|nr:penicillin-binding transpeptidase domain-containing protein [Actinomycetota bacterium]
MKHRLAWLFVVALLGSGCTSEPDEPELPPAQAAFEEFVAAWEERDAAAMQELMARPGGDVERLFRRELLDDVDFELAVVSVVTKDPDEDASALETTAEATYRIEYSLDGSGSTRRMTGRLPMRFEDGAWSVEWDESAMWPAYPLADGLQVLKVWPRRAAILDRRGRTLAAGHAHARRYPFGASAGSTVGHVGVVTRKDAAEDDRYSVGDLAGASGMELAFDERLAGEPGLRLELRADGKTVTTLARTKPERGRPVKTTLDMRLQQAAAGAFGGTTGGAVVLDPSTGDVLAVVTSAELNPAGYVGARDVQPFNRALSGLYPPGSSLKVMTGAAALETGVVDLRTRLTGPAEYKGVRNFESGEFGTLDFATAVRFSVNTAFAQIAEDLGAERLTRFARRFGFNRPPEMALGAATSSFPRPEDEGDLMWGSIGQAQVLATPLQMATVAATIANGGERMEPRISRAVEPEGERVVSKKTAATMRRLMENVVESGTGTGARIAGVRVAGKTGTAEVDVDGKRMNHAWFVAFAPADDPELAVAVVSELGGVGGQVAAPLARAILQATLPLAS